MVLSMRAWSTTPLLSSWNQRWIPISADWYIKIVACCVCYGAAGASVESGEQCCVCEKTAATWRLEDCDLKPTFFVGELRVLPWIQEAAWRLDWRLLGWRQLLLWLLLIGESCNFKYKLWHLKGNFLLQRNVKVYRQPIHMKKSFSYVPLKTSTVMKILL